jgi:nucleotide-binding universal stress UspA family protein
MDAQCSLPLVVESRSSPPYAFPQGGGEGRGKARAEAYLEHVAAKVREQGVAVRTRVVIARHAVEAILAEAAAQASNLIALATHGRGGLQRLLRGSVADRLVRAAVAPVLVYRPTGPLKEQSPGFLSV